MEIEFAVVSILFLVGSSLGNETSNETNICCDETVGIIGFSCCGNKVYNQSEQFCCDRKLHPVSKGKGGNRMGCCSGGTPGKNIYDTSTSACCGGVIWPTFRGINADKFYACCDDPKSNKSRPYIASLFACCEGAILGKQYPNSYELCCGRKLMQNVDPPYNDPEYVSIFGMSGMRQQCCGNKDVYDTNTHICAYFYEPNTTGTKFKVLTLPNSHSSTCGLQLYDTLTQDCCGQRIITKSTHVCCKDKASEKREPAQFYTCCYNDGKLFDIRKQYCAERGIRNLDKAVRQQYDAFLKMCEYFPPALPTYSNVVSKERYLTTNATHICCNGTVGPISMQCCGNGELYDSSRAICCLDKVFRAKKGHDLGQSSCCSSKDGKTSKLFNYNTEVCCDGNVMKKKEINSECCINAETNVAKLYDYSTEVCCSGSVLKKDRPNGYSFTCCTNPKTNVSELVNYETAMCCNGLILEKKNKAKYYECCGNELIEVSYEVVIFGQSGAADRCCGGRLKYKPAKEICASSYDTKTYKSIYKVLPIKNNHTMSCGLKPYDTEKQGCCSEQPYWLSTQTCCNSKVTTTSIPSQFSRCCYPSGEPYDVRKQFCNGTAVADLDPEKAEQIGNYVKKCKHLPLNLPPNY